MTDVTPTDEAKLRVWAEAHSPVGSVQARQVLALLDRIAEARRQLASVDAAVREECAQVAVRRAEFNRNNCSAACKCADGWHIAAAIRAKETPPAFPCGSTGGSH